MCLAYTAILDSVLYYGGTKMIEVTRLNETKLVINSDQIEFVEETPDTVISFLSGKKIIVKESRQEIQNLVILYKKKILSDCLTFHKRSDES